MPVGDLRGHRATARPLPRHRRRERAVLRRRADRRAARRCRAGRAVGACCPGCCSTTSWSHRATRSPSPNPTAPSPSSCCWRSRSRWPPWSTARPTAPAKPGARRRRPNCWRCSPVRCLRGADLTTLLERVRETYSQRAVSLLREDPRGERTSSPAWVQDPCVDVDSADTAIEVGDDEFWLLMAGKKLAARDRRVLGAVAKQAAGPGPAARAHRGGGQGRGDRPGRRTAPLAAVGGQPRPAHAAGRRQGRGVQPAQRRRRLLPRGHRRTAGHRRGVDRPADRAGRQPARLVAAGRRRGQARPAPGVPRGGGAARAARNQQGRNGFGAPGSTGSRSTSATPSCWPTPDCWSGCWST